MTTSHIQTSDSFVSKRGIGLAGLATVLGCIACCAVPLLAAAGLGGGVIAALSAVLRPGAELFIGATVLIVVLGVAAVRRRLNRNKAGCGPACEVGGNCCKHGTRKLA